MVDRRFKCARTPPSHGGASPSSDYEGSPATEPASPSIIREPELLTANGGCYTPEEIKLFRCFATIQLPSLMHPNTQAKFTDQSYLLQLAHFSTPLMNAILAYSALVVSHDSEYYQTFAHKKHGLAIRDLQVNIERQNQNSVTTDHILGTVLCLHLFQVRSRCSLTLAN